MVVLALIHAMEDKGREGKGREGGMFLLFVSPAEYRESGFGEILVF